MALTLRRLSACLCAMALACGGDTPTTPLPIAGAEGDKAGECQDETDNDQDLLVDCKDPDCANAAVCHTRPPVDTRAQDAGTDTQVPPDVRRVDIQAPPHCLNESDYFACAVWAPFMGSTCFACHQSGGVGAEGSQFELIASTPAESGENLERVRLIAAKTVNDESVLLQKARGDLSHGGGVILPAGSAEYNNLAHLLSYFEDPAYCRPTCDEIVELLDEPEEICDAPPVTARVDPTAPASAPPIYTQRLTHWQYRAALNEALGIYIDDIGAMLPPDSSTGSIPSNENYDLPTADYARYATAAASVAEQIMAKSTDDFFDCPGSKNRACAETFIGKRGTRLFRRPLTEPEVQAYLAVYDIGADGSFEEGLRYVLEALLQSPDFLYQIEIQPKDSEGEVRLKGLEIATRLAFFLHARPPSQALLDAALNGELETDGGVGDWVDILLAEPNARFGIQQFILRWLRMDDAHTVERDEALYPDFTSSVQVGLRRGAQLWAAYTVLEGDGLLETLFSAPETIVRLDKAENLFWQLSEADIVATSDRFGTVVALPPSERAGLLTSPMRLANAHNADAQGTRPILRGAALLKNILCGSLEPPQAFEPPAAVEGDSVKDSVSYMLSSPGCAGCHNVLNPLGLAFEIYDGVGRYRDEELDDWGYAIETEGSFGIDGVCSAQTAPFQDAIELIQALAVNEQLRTCATLQWFRYGLRRGPRLDGSDAGNLAQIYAAFAAENFNVRALLKAIALSRPFLYRNFDELGGAP